MLHQIRREVSGSLRIGRCDKAERCKVVRILLTLHDQHGGARVLDYLEETIRKVRPLGSATEPFSSCPMLLPEAFGRRAIDAQVWRAVRLVIDVGRRLAV